MLKEKKPVPNFGASAVVVSDGQVLLIKRRDVEVWALPGGTIDSGESTGHWTLRLLFFYETQNFCF